MITAINATNGRSPGTQNVGPGLVHRGWERKQASTGHQQRFRKKKKRGERETHAYTRSTRGEGFEEIEGEIMRGLVSVLVERVGNGQRKVKG